MENKGKIKLVLQRWRSQNELYDAHEIEAEITYLDDQIKERWEHFLNYPLNEKADSTIVMIFDDTFNTKHKSIELASSDLLHDNVKEALEKQDRKVAVGIQQMFAEVKERLGEYIQTKETITAKQDIVNREIEKLKEAIKCIEFLKK